MRHKNCLFIFAATANFIIIFVLDNDNNGQEAGVRSQEAGGSLEQQAPTAQQTNKHSQRSVQGRGWQPGGGWLRIIKTIYPKTMKKGYKRSGLQIMVQIKRRVTERREFLKSS